MFRIVCGPSSGSIELYLTEIHSGSLIFVVCLIGVWQRSFEPVVCVCVGPFLHLYRSVTIIFVQVLEWTSLFNVYITLIFTHLMVTRKKPCMIHLIGP